MEQLLQLQRLKSTALSEVEVLAVSPDPPEKTRELLGKIERGKGVRLTHRFLSDPAMAAAEAYGIRNAEAKAPMPHPTSILYDRAGREVWRFTEKNYKVRPTDAELAAAVARLRSGPPP